MVITDKHFIDWEADVFGFGYGTGEPHTLEALAVFFASLNERGSYDYNVLEQKLGPIAAWLLINTLGHADVIEYGTSARYGWLAPAGKLLQEYFRGKTVDQLCQIVDTDENYVHCLRHHCNCETPCNNPLF